MTPINSLKKQSIMKMPRILITVIFALCFLIDIFGQVEKTQPNKDDPAAVALRQHLSETDGYVYPKDPKVMENLKKWQGYKFGLLIHMGLYSELGIVESWALCPEDWVTRPGYDDFATITEIQNLSSIPSTLILRSGQKCSKDQVQNI